MNELAARRIEKRFDATPVLLGVDFDLDAGARVVIVGPSGSGKTTLLRLIAGLEVPDAGEILIDGVVVSRPGHVLEPHKRGMGMVFQSSALWPHMTVSQNVRFGLEGWAKAEATARVIEVLERVGVGALADRYPDQISGGEARRVALARALAPRPKWLLFDEPLTNLNRDLRSQLLELIATHVATSGAGMIYVTHAEDEVDALAAVPALTTAGSSAVIMRMESGRLVVDGRAPDDSSHEPDLAD